MSLKSEPWRRWLPLAFGVMGLSPDLFWRLSLAEWQALAEGHALRFGGVRAPALTRGELAALITHYPDRDEIP